MMIFEFLQKMRNRQILKKAKKSEFLSKKTKFLDFENFCKKLKNAKNNSLITLVCQIHPEIASQKSCKTV